MGFNSFRFILLFLPILLAGWHYLNKTGKHTVADVFLILMSLYFYYSFGLSFLLVLLVSLSVNYGLSALMEKLTGEKQRKIIKASERRCPTPFVLPVGSAWIVRLKIMAAVSSSGQLTVICRISFGIMRASYRLVAMARSTSWLFWMYGTFLYDVQLAITSTISVANDAVKIEFLFIMIS